MPASNLNQPEEWEDPFAPQVPILPPVEAPRVNGDHQEAKSKRRVIMPAPNLIDRLPPHSIEAEQGLISCLMLDPSVCYHAILGRIKGAEVFYDLRHQVIFETIHRLLDTGHPVDLISLQQELRNRHQLEAVGGLSYLMALTEISPSASNYEYYLDILFEAFNGRKLIQACAEASAKLYDRPDEVGKILDELGMEVTKLSMDSSIIGEKSVKELVHESIDDIDRFYKNKGALTGIATGFRDFDKLTGGLQNGDMIVIAARPSMGKTSMLMNIVEHVVLEQNLPVGVFSVEMTARSMITRMLCSRARVNLRNVRDGFLAERDFPRLTSAAGKLASSNLHICDSAALTLFEMKAKAQQWVREFGIKLIGIDYLQILDGQRGPKESRAEEVAKLSKGIKVLARQLNVPVIVLSQLNRDLEKEKSRKPRLSDLRESGSIEQDMDVGAFLYCQHSEDDDETTDHSDVMPVNLLLAKQRNGPAGIDIHLTFFKSYTRFESAAKVTAEDVPDFNPHND